MSYLATYASPFEDKETKNTNDDVNVLYSRSDPRGKKTRRNKSTKTRNITDIIQMLHEDMSDTEDTPREGMMNFQDAPDDFLRQTVDKGREAYNYSQRAMMRDEKARLKSEAEMAKHTYEIMKGQNSQPPIVTQSEQTDTNYFSHNEMEFVNNVGSKLSENDAPTNEKMYADTRHITVGNRPLSTADEIKRMTGDDSPHTVQGNVTHDYHKYNVNDETYKTAHFVPRQQYNLNENDGFKYPKWATKKNRTLWNEWNKEREERNDENYAQSEKDLGVTQDTFQDELRHMMKKVDYMIHMFEENEETKNTFMLEELILYCFLGIFVLFIVDSFTNVNVKYKR